MPLTTKCLLLSFAHPDDESFLAAGTVARYARDGVRVALFCATRGGAGKVGEPAVCRPEELKTVREGELRKALEILGVRDLYLADYPDRGLDAADSNAIRRDLLRVLRECRPQVVVTFDPNGSNRHPDHVAISRFTSDAVAAAADARWHPETGRPHQVQRLVWTAPLRPWDAARTEGREALPGLDFIMDVHAFRQQKSDALRAHRSQHLGVDRYFMSQPDRDARLSVEVFRQCWGPPLAAAPADDLFSGIPMDGGAREL